MVEHYYPARGMSLETLPGDMMAQSFRADDELVRRVVAGETECFEDLMLRSARSGGGSRPGDFCEGLYWTRDLSV